jgi:hypothetical protein
MAKMPRKRKPKPTGATISSTRDVSIEGDVVGGDKSINIYLDKANAGVNLTSLLELARGLGDLGNAEGARKREQWDRIADYMSQIAETIERACSQMRDKKAPYREYVMLQRYAENLRRVLAPAFIGEQEQNLTKFQNLLDKSITSIVGFDVHVLKFSDLPIPYELYSSKAGLLQSPESVVNPPIENANLDYQPKVEELEEVAAAFKAEADRIRASGT